MKAEELRIGNYVYYNDKVISIAPNAINEFYYIGDTHSESLVDRRCYKPIELTEEILLKCGFEKRKDGNFNLFKQSEVDIVIDKEFSAWKCDGINFSVGCIKYLHQLQNLYFALTNEELTINL